MNESDLRKLFSACDVNKSGRIEYEDFSTVCQELSVPEDQIRTLFSKCDVDADGCIDYSDFSSSFDEVSEALNLSLLGGAFQRLNSPWDEFENSMDGDVGFYLGRLRDQLSDVYQQIHSSADTLLLQQYESLVQSFVNEIREQRMESEQLETSLRRIEEVTTSQLTELEEDLQQQLASAEIKIKEEEQKKMEGTIAVLQRKHEDEVSDLQAAVERLTKSQDDLELNNAREDINKLHKQIREVTQENEQLRTSLLKAQTNISVLQVELDKLKNAYADQKLQHERENNDLKRMVIEYQSYASQIEILQEMNKKLYDSNDGLRSALVKDKASNRKRLSPRNEISNKKMTPLRQSSFASEEDVVAVHSPREKYSHVASWANKYLDSGVVTSMDTEENSGSDYDSEDSGESMETVHYSYSYAPSEVEMSDQKSEAAVSVAPSGVSSIASSLRRRLSAFPIKQTEVDVIDSDGSLPMYRLVLAGDAGSGKSSFLLRLSLNEFRGDIQTTLGVDFQVKRMLVDGEKTNLQIWDTAGQERFRSIAKSYFRKAHGVLLLYDVTSQSSFLNVREWMDQIRESTDDSIPMCLVGNKVDLRAERPVDTCVSSAHGEKLAMAYNALFCETSAKEGTNVVEAVLHLAREVKKHAKTRRQSDSRVKLSLNNRKKAFTNCCGM
ncbi:ras and EF-hand domain-containing protein [Chanos chanos]|uniref:Ras and EF-hand domain-containing protein n=1 Tax=Chanos chanos TaxID=29144 RepID=A0A6J2UTK9_CHACN|nr:ras and EF-hand domain-containing protein-like [Chanos chanos]